MNFVWPRQGLLDTTPAGAGPYQAGYQNANDAWYLRWGQGAGAVPGVSPISPSAPAPTPPVAPQRGGLLGMMGRDPPSMAASARHMDEIPDWQGSFGSWLANAAMGALNVVPGVTTFAGLIGARGDRAPGLLAAADQVLGTRMAPTVPSASTSAPVALAAGMRGGKVLTGARDSSLGPTGFVGIPGGRLAPPGVKNQSRKVGSGAMNRGTDLGAGRYA